MASHRGVLRRRGQVELDQRLTAREIATAHGATIVLTEAPGGGTRAVVTLGGTAGAAAETTVRSA